MDEKLNIKLIIFEKLVDLLFLLLENIHKKFNKLNKMQNG